MVKMMDVAKTLTNSEVLKENLTSPVSAWDEYTNGYTDRLKYLFDKNN